jgi:hypothetical protein
LNGFSRAACCDSKCNKNKGVFYDFRLPWIVYQPAISVLEKIDLFMPRWGRRVGAGAAGAGQSQPTEGQGDQPQHQRPGATDYSVAGAGTTVGDAQNQPAVDHGD